MNWHGLASLRLGYLCFLLVLVFCSCCSSVGGLIRRPSASVSYHIGPGFPTPPFQFFFFFVSAGLGNV
ncbi:hypothetical protein BDY21DRAFT_353732 [Lineolata rhizophorae]|uniref:Uncharacterized protein n=1 Tax=Lineolata rhizophorae TaxID=578093 RepID=A0A6A6NRE7_9PEZI|nr:hypothetical protein BDY21DRAFT_353732 [Lineolata rhizophorae]